MAPWPMGGWEGAHGTPDGTINGRVDSTLDCRVDGTLDGRVGSVRTVRPEARGQRLES